MTDGTNSGDSPVITRAQQKELDPILNDIAGYGPRILDAVMAAYRLGRAHTPAPGVDVGVSIAFRGVADPVEATAELAAALDDLFTGRYPDKYTGMNVRLDVDMPGVPR